jgi:hypothetical protein
MGCIKLGIIDGLPEVVMDVAGMKPLVAGDERAGTNMEGLTASESRSSTMSQSSSSEVCLSSSSKLPFDEEADLTLREGRTCLWGSEEKESAFWGMAFSMAFSLPESTREFGGKTVLGIGRDRLATGVTGEEKEGEEDCLLGVDSVV